MKSAIEGKEILIYGCGKLQKDFEYIFPELQADLYIDDAEAIVEQDGMEILDVDSFLGEINENAFVIICKREFLKAGKKLELSGLVYGHNFCYGQDLFYLLDLPVNQNKKEVIIWGTGFASEMFHKEISNLYPDFSFSFYVDGKVEPGQVMKHNEKNVFAPADIDFKKYFVIVAILDSYFEVAGALREQGLEHNKDYASFVEIINPPSKLMEDTYFDTSYGENTFLCKRLFEDVEIDSFGWCKVCSYSFMLETKHISLGNLFDGSIERMFSLNYTKVFKLSALNRSYSFCSKDKCPYLPDKEAVLELYHPYQEPDEKNLKKRACICIDPICNLYCTSCRNDYCRLNEKEKKRIGLLTDYITEEAKYLDWMNIAGQGEVFLSKNYKKILEAIVKEEIGAFVLTNGNLFNEEKAELIRKGNGRLAMGFSIDAATAETYDKIRRGGDFNKVLRALKLAGDMRKKGEIHYLKMFFVIQKDNVAEMEKFVKLAQEVGADKVVFTKIQNWGTYSPEDFKEVSVLDDEYEIKEEYRKFFNSPLFELPMVDWLTVKKVPFKTVKTYEICSYTIV